MRASRTAAPRLSAWSGRSSWVSSASRTGPGPHRARACTGRPPLRRTPSTSRSVVVDLRCAGCRTPAAERGRPGRSWRRPRGRARSHSLADAGASGGRAWHRAKWRATGRSASGRASRAAQESPQLRPPRRTSSAGGDPAPRSSGPSGSRGWFQGWPSTPQTRSHRPPDCAQLMGGTPERGTRATRTVGTRRRSPGTGPDRRASSKRSQSRRACR